MNLTVPHEIVHEKYRYFYFDVNISFSSFPFRCKLIIFKMYLFCKWPHRFLFILSANTFVPQMEAKSGPLFFIIVRRSKFLDYLRRFMLLRKTKRENKCCRLFILVYLWLESFRSLWQTIAYERRVKQFKDRSLANRNKLLKLRCAGNMQEENFPRRKRFS